MYGDPFPIACLLLWIPVSIAGFTVLRPHIAATALFLGGMMFLPERVGFDYPGLPWFGKEEISALCILIGALARHRGRLLAAKPLSGVELILVVIVLGGFGTALTNDDALVYGPRVLSPLRVYDGLSMGVADILRYGLPYFLGRVFIRRPQEVRDMLVVIVVAGLVYSLFALVEVRMSPQWHKWVYGFHQHMFHQSIRFGGYRPMIFMVHGLAVALFFAVTVLAATTLYRARMRVWGMPSGPIVAYLLFVLVLCKSVGAAAYTLALLPLLRWLRPKHLRLVILLLALLHFAYPFLRIVDVVPTTTLVEAASVISADRAHSLGFRFRHEDALMTKVRERVLFGWGGYGRGRIYDPRSGKDLSVTDSQWILWLTGRGAVGMVGRYALLLLPVILAMRRFGRIRGPQSRILVLGLALMIDVYAVDTLFNGLYVNFPFFIAGGLTGSMGAFTRRRRRGESTPDEVAVPPRPAPLARAHR